MTRFGRTAALAASVFALGACSSAGGLGSVLGSVLGGGGSQAQQLQGSVRGVDARNQQISVQQSNGQSVAVQYDQNTKVVYQSRVYAVNNLENGDQIVARVTTTQNNTYYTDSITVTQSVTTTTSGGNVDNVQLLSGNVSSIDRGTGTFIVDVGSGTRVTVSMPYNARSADATTYNNMRTGQFVRFYGVYLNSTRVELRNFY
jgi:hypothetical protein